AGESARFAKNLVRGNHVASGVDAFYDLYSRYQTQFIFFGISSQNRSIEEMKAGILKEIKKLQNEPVSVKELNRVKTQIIAQKVFEKDSIFGQAMEIGLLETLGLGWKTAQIYTDKINGVTPEQIQKAAQRYFQPKLMTEAQLFPVLQPEGQQ